MKKGNMGHCAAARAPWIDGRLGPGPQRSNFLVKSTVWSLGFCGKDLENTHYSTTFHHCSTITKMLFIIYYTTKKLLVNALYLIPYPLSFKHNRPDQTQLHSGLFQKLGDTSKLSFRPGHRWTPLELQRD